MTFYDFTRLGERFERLDRLTMLNFMYIPSVKATISLRALLCMKRSLVKRTNFKFIPCKLMFSLKRTNKTKTQNNKNSNYVRLSKGCYKYWSKNRPIHGFFQLLILARYRSSIDTARESTLKLVKWPCLRVMSFKIAKIWLYKVGKFYRRLYAGDTNLTPA